MNQSDNLLKKEIRSVKTKRLLIGYLYIPAWLVLFVLTIVFDLSIHTIMLAWVCILCGCVFADSVFFRKVEDKYLNFGCDPVKMQMISREALGPDYYGKREAAYSLYCGDLQRAVNVSKSLLEDNSVSGTKYYFRTVMLDVYFLTGNFDGLKVHLDEVFASLEDEKPRARRKLMAQYSSFEKLRRFCNGEYAEFAAGYERSLAEKGEKASVFSRAYCSFRAGVGYFYAGDHQRARDFLEQSVALAPRTCYGMVAKRYLYSLDIGRETVPSEEVPLFCERVRIIKPNRTLRLLIFVGVTVTVYLVLVFL